MKTQFNLSVEASVVGELRALSEASGVSLSGLAEVAFGAICRLGPQKAAALAESRQKARQRAQGLNKQEALVSNALRKLYAREKGEAWGFPVKEIAGVAGLRLRDTWLAVRSLQAREIVFSVAEGGELDKYGRPEIAVFALRELIPAGFQGALPDARATAAGQATE